MLHGYPDCTDKIEPIIAAIRFAKRLSGDQSEAAALALIHDAVFTHWELRHGGLDATCHSRSKLARGLSDDQLVIDWPIPRDFLAKQLLEVPSVDLRVPLIQRLLYELAGFIFLTKEEQNKLYRAGLATGFPPEWDGFDRYIRYSQRGIVVGEPVTYDRVQIEQMLSKPVLPFYVYLLRDPKGGIFYVGKGEGYRALNHEKELLRGAFPVHTNWKKLNAIARILVGKHSLGYEINSWHYDEMEALAREDKLIIKYERLNPWKLCNSNGRRFRGKPSRWLVQLRSEREVRTRT
jgi:hypothetical protein